MTWIRVALLALKNTTTHYLAAVTATFIPLLLSPPPLQATLADSVHILRKTYHKYVLLNQNLKAKLSLTSQGHSDEDGTLGFHHYFDIRHNQDGRVSALCEEIPWYSFL